ncbi:hypothetical protein ACFFG9_35640, partial [Kutzneria buriramensis]
PGLRERSRLMTQPALRTEQQAARQALVDAFVNGNDDTRRTIADLHGDRTNAIKDAVSDGEVSR